MKQEISSAISPALEEEYCYGKRKSGMFSTQATSSRLKHLFSPRTMRSFPACFVFLCALVMLLHTLTFTRICSSVLYLMCVVCSFCFDIILFCCNICCKEFIILPLLHPAQNKSQLHRKFFRHMVDDIQWQGTGRAACLPFIRGCAWLKHVGACKKCGPKLVGNRLQQFH